MAALHRAAFAPSRPWSVHEFRDLLDDPKVRCFGDAAGFLLIRTVLDDAEVLTLAIHPDHQRQGHAQRLLSQWFGAPGTAHQAFLEVANDNAPALALYRKTGFQQAGLRKAYYPRPNGAHVDAIVMRRHLTQR
ncbi:MAG: GNAT family N-acetyltransferase [Sedimentitalea sp.]